MSDKKGGIGSRVDGDGKQKGRAFRGRCGCHVGVRPCAIDEDREALGWSGLGESPSDQRPGLGRDFFPVRCPVLLAHCINHTSSLAQAVPYVQEWVSKALHVCE